jgi:hypothetical protein
MRISVFAPQRPQKRWLAFQASKRRPLRQRAERRLVEQPLHIDRAVVDRLQPVRQIVGLDAAGRRQHRHAFIPAEQHGMLEPRAGHRTLGDPEPGSNPAPLAFSTTRPAG